MFADPMIDLYCRSDVAAGATVRTEVPSFVWRVTGDTWWWSPGSYRLYGYRAAEVRPTTVRFLNHVHPSDRQGLVDAVHRCARGTGTVVHEHRTVDMQGQTSTVVLAAKGTRDARGEVELVGGVLLPVTSSGDWDPTAWWVSAVAVICGVTHRAAAELLRWRAGVTDDTDTVMHRLAELAILGDDEQSLRRSFDAVFLCPPLRTTGGAPPGGFDARSADSDPAGSSSPTVPAATGQDVLR
jgi:hypothetical protein